MKHNVIIIISQVVILITITAVDTRGHGLKETI